MIEVDRLTKRYGDKIAVDDLSFIVPPGIITGFLGPNGAGKSTTMRMMLGLDAPTSGRVTVNGKSYADLPAPLNEIGAMLEAHSVHTGRSAYHHLLALAATHGLPRSRVDEVIELVGLKEVARKRVGGFSLGMGQRLGIAAALIGDPTTVILDEPVNGLDPDGIRWIRNLLKRLADDGRTVFLSSHLMSEMELTAERLIVVGRGRLIADTTVAEFVKQASVGAPVRVRTPDIPLLLAAVRRLGARIESIDEDVVMFTGVTSTQIGDAAQATGVAVHELVPQQVSLEDAFMRITHDAVEYRTGAPLESERTAA
jgi:ABC-2 type transport system ATP-binding protein